ncbi:UDP-N-acetylmuramoyl-tripeptide--D-alanyl-D-alanine ligase [Paenibacillus sp. LHD-117]|uniref:UDP-N-acetylmuramoyl-tripeptide--D-alanyl-D- alanine ligase n=1 Tax=Paenibacillus sp. LHD-117 TaxID=3071412 RepID=UPI0027DEDFFE|nr:UDP-N-acetylmuramoyl-tripeptide--D-alanyl-D-alanine ligase [Paenibacillus sp. LHD-117]MDQ6418970.1 UDP-N-acetylmuramoyl-tripeptide--D-alanyl-D-alanine ligase [Paenibacillus sp. LHD-117]
MIKRTIGQIAAMCGAVRQGGHHDTLLTGVTTDSRRTGGGELFVPLVGERFDGHDFAAQAAANGAKAMLWQKGRDIPADLPDVAFLIVKDTLEALQRLASTYRNELTVRVVGITGSNGKTTTKDMTAALLSASYSVLKTEGNLNNHIGLPLTLLRLEEETEVAVLEMGMSGFGEIELLTKLASPDLAIITNIGDAHMLQLGSRGGIAKAKLEIALGLGESGVLLYNGDEPLLREGLAGMMLPEGLTLRTFGLGPDNEWSAEQIELYPDSSAFAAMNRGQVSSVGSVHIPVPGRHNISNALAAIAAARFFGVPAEKIAQSFRQLKLTSMRIEPSKAFNGAVILNDAYNANPTAVRAAIDLVGGLKGFRRRWVVLGDMLELGPEEAELHRGIGAYLTPDSAEGVLTYGSLSANTSEGAKASLPEADQAGNVRHFDDKDQLAEWLKDQLLPEDLVLVKGSRGMRMEQVVQALEKG